MFLIKTLMPSPTIINRRVGEYGDKLKQFLPDCVADTKADAVIPDGTKCYSQDGGRSYHSIQATLGENTADKSHSLLEPSVNGDWNKTAAELDDTSAVTDDATVVSDGDSGIVTAFTDESHDHNLTLFTSAERWTTISGMTVSSHWISVTRSSQR